MKPGLKSQCQFTCHHNVFTMCPMVTYQCPRCKEERELQHFQVRFKFGHVTWCPQNFSSWKNKFSSCVIEISYSTKCRSETLMYITKNCNRKGFWGFWPKS